MRRAAGVQGRGLRAPARRPLAVIRLHHGAAGSGRGAASGLAGGVGSGGAVGGSTSCPADRPQPAQACAEDHLAVGRAGLVPFGLQLLDEVVGPLVQVGVAGAAADREDVQGLSGLGAHHVVRVRLGRDVQGQDAFLGSGALEHDGPGGRLADLPARVALQGPDEGFQHLGVAAEIGVEATAELLGGLDSFAAVAAAAAVAARGAAGRPGAADGAERGDGLLRIIEKHHAAPVLTRAAAIAGRNAGNRLAVGAAAAQGAAGPALRGQRHQAQQREGKDPSHRSCSSVIRSGPPRLSGGRGV